MVKELLALVMIACCTYGKPVLTGPRNCLRFGSLLSQSARAVGYSNHAILRGNSKLFSSSSSSSYPSSPGNLLSKPLLVSIEGNIGAGKSTLLNFMKQQHPEWTYIDEPVSFWSSLQNEEGVNILELFYKDKRRWAYTFQNCAMLSRFQNIQESIHDKMTESSSSSSDDNKRNVFITERCMETDYHVFTKMLTEDGSIDKLEYNLYLKLFDHLKKEATPLGAIIHVDTTPDVCKDRILKRGRSGEENIPIDYLKRLDKYQREWVSSCTVPHIDCTESESDKVISFINGLSLAK